MATTTRRGGSSVNGLFRPSYLGIHESIIRTEHNIKAKSIKDLDPIFDPTNFNRATWYNSVFKHILTYLTGIEDSASALYTDIVGRKNSGGTSADMQNVIDNTYSTQATNYLYKPESILGSLNGQITDQQIVNWYYQRIKTEKGYL